MVSPILVPVIGEIIGTIGKVADDLITSDEERGRLTLDEYKAESDRLISQTNINIEEAKSSSTWVAGARPFIMWVCGVAFAYATILEPMLRFASQVWFNYEGTFPVIDTELTMQVLFGILGLGLFRTAEKYKGVAR